jgi:hypothetical protein
MGKNMNRHLTVEDEWIANKPMRYIQHH